MNDLIFKLVVSLDHDLDPEAVSELTAMLQEHIEKLYDEPGPTQSYFSRVDLTASGLEFYQETGC